MRKLGSGGMADVYLAEDEELGRRVAIKILNDKYAPDDQFVERFRREAKNAAGLSHPNIVSIYDRGEAEGTHVSNLRSVSPTRTRSPAASLRARLSRTPLTNVPLVDPTSSIQTPSRRGSTRAWFAEA